MKITVTNEKEPFGLTVEAGTYSPSYETLSGSIVTFSDAWVGSTIYPKASIVPVQSGSGNPSPDNIRPITGFSSVDVSRCGKNLIKNLKYQSTTTTVILGQEASDTFETYLPTGTYTISYSSSVTGSIYMRSAGGGSNVNLATNATQATFTITTAGYYRFWIYKSGGIITSDISSFQIELGEEKTDYVPYNGITKTISLGSTIYGGTLDVTTGVLTVTNVKHTVASGDSTSLFQTGDNANRVGIPVSDAVAGTDAATRLLPICNIAQASSTVPFTPETQALGYCALYNKIFLVCVPTTATDANSAKSWLVSNGCEFVYPLATPTTIQLTGEEITALLGENNVWADTGDTTVVYRADTKLYIDKRLGA